MDQGIRANEAGRLARVTMMAMRLKEEDVFEFV
jgi:hypothetical protein